MDLGLKFRRNFSFKIWSFFLYKPLIFYLLTLKNPYIRRRKKAVDRDSNRLFKLKKHYTNMSKRKKDPNGDLRFVHK